MGKTKTKKFRCRKSQPSDWPNLMELEGMSSESALSESQNTDPKDTHVFSEILDKLQSTKPEERECGCSLVATLAGQASTQEVLLKHGGLKVLSSLVLDTSPHVQRCALGALRNISAQGSQELCEEMVEKDVTTPLIALFHKYGTGWAPDLPENSGSKVPRIKVDIFTEAVHLLWNLCENSDLAVQIFNKENLIKYLLPCLSEEVRGMYGMPTAIAVAHCLQTVTENNREAASACQESSHLSHLLSLTAARSSESQHILLKALASAVVANTFGFNLSSSSGNVATSIVTAVADILSVDTNSLLAQTCSQNGHADACAAAEHAGPAVDEDCSSRLLMEVEQILTAQQVALAVAANLCSSDDDEWEDVGSNESTSSEELATSDCTMEVETSSELFDPFPMSGEVVKTMQQVDLVKKVVALSLPRQTECLASLHSSPDRKELLQRLGSLQADALLCLNNLVSASQDVLVGGIEHVHLIWDSLSQLCTSAQADCSQELLEAVTSAMRAVMERLGKLKSPKFSEITSADLQFLFGLGCQCPSSQVRVNAIHIASTISCLLAQSPQPHPLLKESGQHLMGCVERDSDLWVVAEALDAIFDVFGEDHLDPVAKEIGLLPRLKQFLPIFKTRMNGQKKSLEPHWPLLLTVKSNLVRFISYKSK